jgi:hypothetical protein
MLGAHVGGMTRCMRAAQNRAVLNPQCTVVPFLLSLFPKRLLLECRRDVVAFMSL